MAKAAAVAIQTLTNGLDNFIFRIEADRVTVEVVDQFGAKTGEDVYTLEQGRKIFIDAQKFHHCTRGWTNAHRDMPVRFEELMPAA